jgi:prevent-host-death family protein
MQLAYAHFAESEGPQDITLHVRSAAIVLSRKTFKYSFDNKNSPVNFRIIGVRPQFHEQPWQNPPNPLKSDQSSQNWSFIMHTWQIQEAKARLSEVVKLAESEGPQDITLHGRSVAVVLSRKAFERLSGSENSLVEFMRQSPLHGLEEIEFERDRSMTREVTL